MDKNIYQKEGVVDTIVKGDVIIVTWHILHDSEALYGSCRAQLELVQQDLIKLIIIDVANSKGTPPQDVQQWFVNELFPGYAKSGAFKGLVNVLPQNAVTKMGSKRWKKSAESGNFGFEVFETDSVDSAMNLAQEL